MLVKTVKYFIEIGDFTGHFIYRVREEILKSALVLYAHNKISFENCKLGRVAFAPHKALPRTKGGAVIRTTLDELSEFAESLFIEFFKLYFVHINSLYYLRKALYAR